MKIRKLLMIPGIAVIAAIPTMSIVGCGQEIKITDLSLSSDFSSFEQYDQTQIRTTFTPANATNKELEWSVDDTSKATINNQGVITFKDTGSVTITAKTKDGSDITKSITINIVEPTTSSETYSEYIYNRTFSLLSYVRVSEEKAGGVFGTGWVLADSTPSITTDYKYYIATNWHVIKGQEDLIAKAYQGQYSMRFGCSDSESGVAISTTEKFASFNKIAQANFTYNNSDTITTEQYDESGTYKAKTGLKGCDVYIVEVDFGDLASSTRASATIAKEKLDKLNALTAAGKKITTLAPTTTDSSHYETYKLYTGGYPYSSTLKCAKWECHDLSEDDEDVNLTYKAQGTKTHWADNHDNPLTDCSPQYAYTDSGYFEDWMCGGASGSMLVANFGTSSEPIWKVAGIYWGGLGYSTTEHDYIKPYFSIFNSNWKNYLAEWA